MWNYQNPKIDAYFESLKSSIVISKEFISKMQGLILTAIHQRDKWTNDEKWNFFNEVSADIDRVSVLSESFKKETNSMIAKAIFNNPE